MTDDNILISIELINTFQGQIDALNKKIEEEKEKIKNEMAARGTEKMTLGGYNIFNTTVSSKRFDTSKFKKEQPDVYDKYLKTQTIKRFAINKIKTTDDYVIFKSSSGEDLQFKITNKIPDGYSVWSIPSINADTDKTLIPLCVTTRPDDPDCLDVDITKLLALRVEPEEYDVFRDNASRGLQNLRETKAIYKKVTTDSKNFENLKCLWENFDDNQKLAIIKDAIILFEKYSERKTS